MGTPERRGFSDCLSSPMSFILSGLLYRHHRRRLGQTEPQCLYLFSAGQRHYRRWPSRAGDGRSLTSCRCQQSEKGHGYFRRGFLGSYPLLAPGGIPVPLRPVSRSLLQRLSCGTGSDPSGAGGRPAGTFWQAGASFQRHPLFPAQCRPGRRCP